MCFCDMCVTCVVCVGSVVWESVLAFHRVSSGDQTQVVRLGGIPAECRVLVLVGCFETGSHIPRDGLEQAHREL